MKNRIEAREKFRTAPRPRSGVNNSARTSFALAISLVVFLLGFPLVVHAAGSPRPPQTPMVVRGTLGLLSANQPTLQTGGRSYKLAGQSAYIFHTLQDKRLLHQELQLVGTMGSNGDFVVQRLYAVRDGKLYKIQYYCEVCNITYVQPGHCACCGRETKLQEVPAGQAQ